MLKWLFGEPMPPKKLKFKQGEMAQLKIANVKGMVTHIFPCSSRCDYRFEWYNHKTGKPERVRLYEFEIKKVKKNG